MTPLPASLMEAIPLLDVLAAVRLRVQAEAGIGPRERAIVTRYVEDAIAWTYTAKSELIPPIPR